MRCIGVKFKMEDDLKNSFQNKSSTSLNQSLTRMRSIKSMKTIRKANRVVHTLNRSLTSRSGQRNASINSSGSSLKQSLKNNNRNLARALEQARQTISMQQSEITENKAREQAYQIKIGELKHIASLNNDSVENEIKKRMQKRTSDLKSLLTGVSTNLIDAVDRLSKAVSMCSDPVPRHISSIGSRGHSLESEDVLHNEILPTRSIYYRGEGFLTTLKPVQNAVDNASRSLLDGMADVAELGPIPFTQSQAPSLLTSVSENAEFERRSVSRSISSRHNSLATQSKLSLQDKEETIDDKPEAQEESNEASHSKQSRSKAKKKTDNEMPENTDKAAVDKSRKKNSSMKERIDGKKPSQKDKEVTREKPAVKQMNQNKESTKDKNKVNNKIKPLTRDRRVTFSVDRTNENITDQDDSLLVSDESDDAFNMLDRSDVFQSQPKVLNTNKTTEELEKEICKAAEENAGTIQGIPKVSTADSVRGVDDDQTICMSEDMELTEVINFGPISLNNESLLNPHIALHNLANRQQKNNPLQDIERRLPKLMGSEAANSRPNTPELSPNQIAVANNKKTKTCKPCVKADSQPVILKDTPETTRSRSKSNFQVKLSKLGKMTFGTGEKDTGMQVVRNVKASKSRSKQTKTRSKAKQHVIDTDEPAGVFDYQGTPPANDNMKVYDPPGSDTSITTPPQRTSLAVFRQKQNKLVTKVPETPNHAIDKCTVSDDSQTGSPERKRKQAAEEEESPKQKRCRTKVLSKPKHVKEDKVTNTGSKQDDEASISKSKNVDESTDSSTMSQNDDKSLRNQDNPDKKKSRSKLQTKTRTKSCKPTTTENSEKTKEIMAKSIASKNDAVKMQTMSDSLSKSRAETQTKTCKAMTTEDNEINKEITGESAASKKDAGTMQTTSEPLSRSRRTRTKTSTTDGTKPAKHSAIACTQGNDELPITHQKQTKSRTRSLTKTVDTDRRKAIVLPDSDIPVSTKPRDESNEEIRKLSKSKKKENAVADKNKHETSLKIKKVPSSDKEKYKAKKTKKVESPVVCNDSETTSAQLEASVIIQRKTHTTSRHLVKEMEILGANLPFCHEDKAGTVSVSKRMKTCASSNDDLDAMFDSDISLLEDYAKPPNKRKVVASSKLQEQQESNDKVVTCSSSEESEIRRPRRGAGTVSYAEPKLGSKLRQGDPGTTTIYQGKGKPTFSPKKKSLILGKGKKSVTSRAALSVITNTETVSH